MQVSILLGKNSQDKYAEVRLIELHRFDFGCVTDVGFDLFE